jgi:hypothetical protein
LAWEELAVEYGGELEQEPAKTALKDLREHVAKGRVTLVRAARDESHNNAFALLGWLKLTIRHNLRPRIARRTQQPANFLALRKTGRGALLRQALKLGQIGKAFAAIDDQEFQQALAALGVDPATLNAPLPGLRHEPRGNELRDVMSDGRLWRPKRALDRADRQAALAGSDQKAEYLQAVRVSELRQTSRCVVERHSARCNRRPHPQEISSDWEAGREEIITSSSLIRGII